MKRALIILTVISLAFMGSSHSQTNTLPVTKHGPQAMGDSRMESSVMTGPFDPQMAYQKMQHDSDDIDGRRTLEILAWPLTVSFLGLLLFVWSIYPRQEPEGK